MPLASRQKKIFIKNKMKKLIIILALLGFTFSQSEARVRYKRMWDSGCNGEYYAFKENGGVDQFGDRWWIIWCTCDASGTCPTSMVAYNGGGELDNTDLAAYEQLFHGSDASIGLGNESGSISANFQVSGESFYRHYIVTWVLNNGYYEQTIDRTDIEN